MHETEVPLRVAIALIVLVQATNLTPMVGNLLKVAADNLLKVVVGNLLKVVADNALKVANKNHLVADNLVIHLQRIHKVASKSFSALP